MRNTQTRINFILPAFLLSLLWLPGCSGVRPMVDMTHITATDEANYGKQINPFILQHLGATIQDETIQSYLDKVGARLKTDNQSCTFTFVNDPAPGAYTLPDGEIVVTRGLFFYLETEQELLVLLAHLVGHDQARDGLQLVLSHVPNQKSGEQNELLSDYEAAAVAGSFLHATLRDDQELLADHFAEEIMKRSGFDPALVFDLMSKIYNRLSGLPDYQKGSFAKRHPFSSKRHQGMESTLSAVPFSDAVSDTKNSDTFADVRALLVATRHAYEYYQKAFELEINGEIDQAISFYLKAAVAAPEEALLLTGLGMVYMRQDVLVAARQHLTRASRLDSYYYYPQLGLGYIYLQQKEYANAAKRLRRSQSLLPTAQGGYLLAQVLDEAGNSQAALMSYRDVVHYFKGSRLAQLAEERIIELESALELD